MNDWLSFAALIFFVAMIPLSGLAADSTNVVEKAPDAKWDFEGDDELAMKECAVIAEPGRGKCLKLVSPSSRATVKATAAGGFVSDGNDSRIKMFFRYGDNDVATRPLPTNVVTAADARRAAGEDMAWFDKVTAKGRGIMRSDKNVRIPNTTGAVLRNTEFYNLRGRGIQVHCGNMLIEDVKVHDVTGVGISIHALLSWSMCFDIYNVLVRNCTFERLGGGCAVSTCPGWIDPERPMPHRMHFAIELDGCTIDPGGGKPGVRVSNADDVTIKGCRFGPGCSLPPVETKNSTRVKLVE